MSITNVIVKMKQAMSQAEKLVLDGVEYERVKWNSSAECPDCGISGFGVYHMTECDQEPCPICGLQLLSCPCFEPAEIRNMSLEELYQHIKASSGELN